ncbi:hypothetical protein BSL78_24904 [Apostichopus japonicus]|uniref:ABC transporter domain-containing protein n=1 Tax=Stichopus japonicus TaxID=307972 RepID=A0A2G8JRA1_STIJA|nr:hypothetical protein BSL78_24904 [Apostichopus japonicus]
MKSAELQTISSPLLLKSIKDVHISGAGKTTLLNVFNQRELTNLEVQGNVLLNGNPMVSLDNNQRALLGYVQQHDILPGELTVREYLHFTANLSLGSKMPKTKKQQRVDDLLEQLSLKKCADTRIKGKGSISGGEKKRLSVACKLLGRAQLLFLDEPTTGLDSYIAKVLIHNLKKLTRNGYNIVCTIHQPSSDVFNLFDNVYFLANGKTAYAGPQDAILDYFSPLGYVCPDNFSPADYYIAVLSVAPGAEKESFKRNEYLCDHFLISPAGKLIEGFIGVEYTRQEAIRTSRIPETEDVGSLGRLDEGYNYFASGGNTSWFTKFAYLSWRSAISLSRNPSLLCARLATTIFMSVILVIIYFHPDQTIDQGRIVDTQGMLFFFCANFTLVNSNRLMEVIPRELPLLIREYKDGLYDVTSYFLSTLLTQSVVAVVLLIISVAVIYLCGGLRLEWDAITICIAILTVAFYVNVTFVMCQSVIWETQKRVMVAVPQLCFIMNVLGGYYINIRTIPVILKPITYFDWILSSFEALSINQWRDVENIECSYHRQEPCILTGEAVLDQYGFKTDDFFVDIGFLFLQLFGYLSFSCVLLFLKMKYKWT